MDCKNIQVMKNGVCIAESLGKCKGCGEEFFDDLENAGFKGLKITERGIIPFALKNQ
jgi:hypothetical protein|tara:strand:+ start:3933 stop:4103 length:171 start_codon:yes stop_codon:yes gene_type:complete